jgi:hypothetical protein
LRVELILGRFDFFCVHVSVHAGLRWFLFYTDVLLHSIDPWMRTSLLFHLFFLFCLFIFSVSRCHEINQIPCIQFHSSALMEIHSRKSCQKAIFFLFVCNVYTQGSDRQTSFWMRKQPNCYIKQSSFIFNLYAWYAFKDGNFCVFYDGLE